jgi:hypothetical protein
MLGHSLDLNMDRNVIPRQKVKIGPNSCSGHLAIHTAFLVITAPLNELKLNKAFKH